MNDLQQYLSLPATHRLYSAGLSLFNKYGGELRHDPRYTKLQSGPFGRNPELLHELLCQIAKNPPAAPAPILPSNTRAASIEVITEEKQTHKDALLRQVNKELIAAWKKRKQLSDRFWDMDTDEERADNSDRIATQQKIINQLDAELRYVKQHGKRMPTEDENFVLPDSDAELSVLQNRKQSHKAKLIRDIEGLRKKGGKDKKIAEKEEVLQNIVIQIQLIKEKRECLKQQKQ